MKIIIPMTGYGSRFVAAGYTDLKPLIPVQGKPMLQWIVEGMFPGETDFLFICRQEHLDTISGMEETLLRIAPTAQLFAIKNWEKKGPVYDVLQASEKIDEEEACIINYCDFYMIWDWERFKKDVTERKCDGCIPCYSGFHPHLMIPKNVYASCQTDEKENLIAIREKYSFEADKTKAKHSPGTYYFRTGKLLKEYGTKLVESQETLYGEYYASLSYHFMVQDKRTVWVPVNVEFFCQWGTPEDLKEYLFWTNMIRRWH